MATAVLRSHDVLDNRMHLDAFGASPSKPRRRRQAKPAAAAAASSPPKTSAVVSLSPKTSASSKMPSVSSPAPKPVAPKMVAVSSPAPKTVAVSSPVPKTVAPKIVSVSWAPAVVASPVPKAAASSRRSPPARPARKQPSPTKEKPKNLMVMEEVRILKRGEEPPAPAQAPAPSPAPARVPAVAQAAPKDQRVLGTTSRIGPQKPAVVPAKIVAVTGNAAGYAGPAFSAAAPEPSSLPFPAFFLRQAEAEATRGLRCLLRIGELS